MIKDEIVVKRYTEAFIGAAQESIGVAKALEDLGNLRNIVIRENPEFLEFLGRMEITYTEKYGFIDKVLGADFSEETRQLLRLLLDKGRIDKLVNIAEYARFTYLHEGKVTTLLKTSFPLDLDLIKLIKDTLENKFQIQLKLYIELDPSLLGGIQVIIGNRIIDASVKGNIDDLKETLMMIRM